MNCFRAPHRTVPDIYYIHIHMSTFRSMAQKAPPHRKDSAIFDWIRNWVWIWHGAIFSSAYAYPRGMVLYQLPFIHTHAAGLHFLTVAQFPREVSAGKGRPKERHVVEQCF
jgi:hypothetical protein